MVADFDCELKTDDANRSRQKQVTAGDIKSWRITANDGRWYQAQQELILETILDRGCDGIITKSDLIDARI